MATIHLPVTGNMTQALWNSFLSPFDTPYYLVSIEIGRTSKPELEEEILSEVGSYGRQLGCIGDALGVLLRHFRPQAPLTADERKAIDAIQVLLSEIAEAKALHARAAGHA